jgi:hypothetical protein
VDAPRKIRLRHPPANLRDRDADLVMARTTGITWSVLKVDGAASPERLMRFLHLTPGAVSPFGLIHDSAREVIVVLDSDLPGTERIGFHPNVNTATMTLATDEFLRFLAAKGNVVKRVRIHDEP